MITPIFIPIRSHSSGPHAPEHECPKCGHKFDSPDDDERHYGLYIFLTIVAIVLTGMIALMIDDLALGNRYYMWATVRDDCEFSLPNFEIVPNGKGEFAVKYKPKGEYFCQGKDYILYSPSISEPTLFISECNARGYLKEWYNRPFK